MCTSAGENTCVSFVSWHSAKRGVTKLFVCYDPGLLIQTPPPHHAYLPACHSLNGCVRM